MLKKKVIGLQEIYNKRGKINLSDVRNVREELSRLLKKPKVKLNRISELKYGDHLSFKIEDYPLPEIDIFEGKLISRKQSEDEEPIYLVFRGSDGPIVETAKYNIESKEWSFKIPKKARDGVIIMYLPAKEVRGGGYFTPGQDNDNGICLAPKQLFRSEKKMLHYQTFIDPIYIQCNKCQTDPFCPNDAIKFDENGKCYVWDAACKGMSYRVDSSEIELSDDGREVFKRLDEITCFECVSLCDKKLMWRRVALFSCCGNCDEYSRLKCIPPFPPLSLKDNCKYDAIHGGADAPEPSPFIVDVSKCIGCMECYNNINCYNSSGPGGNLKMVARTIHPWWWSDLIISSISMRISEQQRSDSKKSQKKSKGKSEEIILRVWGEGINSKNKEDIHISFDSKNRYDFNGKRFTYKGNLHMALFPNVDGLILYEGGGIKFPVRTLSYEKLFKEGKKQKSGTLTFNTDFGIFDLEYKLSDNR
ncbi:MAG: hypothetical protein ACFFAN_05715 [Promethearchaeota archaeon]